MGVGEGGGHMRCWHVGCWVVCLGYLGVICGGVGDRIEAMCDWGRVPRFGLKYVELVGDCL